MPLPFYFDVSLVYMPKLIDWLFMALLQIETNGKLNSLLAKESAAICNSALNCPLRKSLVEYSKTEHFYFGTYILCYSPIKMSMR